MKTTKTKNGDRTITVNGPIKETKPQVRSQRAHRKQQVKPRVLAKGEVVGINDAGVTCIRKTHPLTGDVSEVAVFAEDFKSAKPFPKPKKQKK
jgi:hypothetical protein